MYVMDQPSNISCMGLNTRTDSNSNYHEPGSNTTHYCHYLKVKQITLKYATRLQKESKQQCCQKTPVYMYFGRGFKFIPVLRLTEPVELFL